MRAVVALCCAAVAACATGRQAQAPDTALEKGTLFIAGGGDLGDELIGHFVALAGGADAQIVVIPTAATGDSFPADWPSVRMIRDAGAGTVTLLHTRSPDVANSRDFVDPLRRATGVWIAGGRQWRLADAYNNTLTLREIEALLRRGGVVGGTSAGASIQASYMVRGAVESNAIMMAPGHETGFGLLPTSAIDQHLTARGRQNDMLQVIQQHPALLGIGIDEGTALIVNGRRAFIAGRGRVAFYNTTDSGDLDYYFLSPGDTFDLEDRRTVSGPHIAPSTVQDETEVIAAMNHLFTAMRSRDTAAIRALAHPDLRVFVPFESDGRRVVRVSTLDAFIDQIDDATQRLDERPIRPEVRIDGPLASVWTRYEFRLGERFSHCGTDAFHFVKDGADWIFTALAYTVQRTGCER